MLDLTPSSRFLGRGTFGEVFEKDSPGGKVAVKHLWGRDAILLRGELLAEGLRHSCVVRLLGVSLTPARGEIIMVQGGDGTALDFLQWCPEVLPTHVLYLAGDAVSGVAYLHSQNLIHLDLKPDNVLWCQLTRRARIADFGRMCLTGLRVRVLGAAGWCAPELRSKSPDKHEVVATEALDVWPLGTLLQCLAAAQLHDIFASVSGVLSEVATPMQSFAPDMRGCAKEAENKLRARTPLWRAPFDEVYCPLSRAESLDWKLRVRVANFLPFSAS